MGTRNSLGEEKDGKFYSIAIKVDFESSHTSERFLRADDQMDGLKEARENYPKAHLQQQMVMLSWRIAKTTPALRGRIVDDSVMNVRRRRSPDRRRLFEIAPATALRQTCIVFAGLTGASELRGRPGLVEFVSTMMTMAGALRARASKFYVVKLGSK